MAVDSPQSRRTPEVFGRNRRRSVDGVDVEEHAGEEKDEEGEGVKDEDVGHVGDTGVRYELHLLFGGTHEKEAGCVEKLIEGISTSSIKLIISGYGILQMAPRIASCWRLHPGPQHWLCLSGQMRLQ